MLIGEKKISRPLRWGMLGGGRTANVGPKHRRGALYDNTAFKLVCGAFDVDPVRLSSAQIWASTKTVSIPITRQ